MYLEYWGLKKHPFNNVPDPEMYFDMHQTVDQAVSEVLFAIEEGDEVLAVVVGPVGAGKTMSLRIVLDSLDHDKHRIAFVTNPDMTFPQLLRETVGQLQGKVCEEQRKDSLLEIFNKIIFETNNQGKRVVIFIDEGNVIKPHNLDSLRLLTNMQDDSRNVFTIVLAGQPELGRRLEDPLRDNLYQRIGVYCKIEGIASLETMQDYVEHRLERAGLDSDKRIFTDEAYKALWESSENGMPRVINKLCKLSLKAAETNKLTEVDERVVKGIASRFMRTYRSQRETAEEFAKTAAPPPAATDKKLKKTTREQRAAAKKLSSRRMLAKKSTSRPVSDRVVTEIIPEELAGLSAPPFAKRIIATQMTPPPIAKLPPEKKPSRVPPAQPTKKLSREDIEKLASRLATERVNKMKNITDPFEAWEKARNDILAQMLKGQK